MPRIPVVARTPVESRERERRTRVQQLFAEIAERLDELKKLVR